MKTCRTIALLLILAGAGAAACSSGGPDTGATPASTPTGTLLPAGQVEASRAAQQAVTVALGQPGALPDGMTVTVSGPVKVSGDADGPWLVVARVRVENPGAQDAQPPNVGIVCAGSKQGYPVAGGTLDLTKVLPARTYREGSMYLLRPGDARTGEPVPACKAPAFIEAVPVVFVGSVPPSVRVPLPDSTVTALNARR